MNWFDVSGKKAVITGGGGILCSEMARALAAEGVDVAVLDINLAAAQAVADDINKNCRLDSNRGGRAIAVQADVLDRSSLEKARNTVLEQFGRVDVLINGAGGNKKEATADDVQRFFQIPPEAIQWVFNLNVVGSVMTSQVFGEVLASQGAGVVINISSMAADRPLTKVISYSAAKAAIDNFTKWLAVHFNQLYSVNIRVNAIAPGFFLTEQNRYLLTDRETGAPTERGRLVIQHTPMGRYGTPDELIGTLIWLISDGARFVNGAVIPVDGGFSAFSGV